MKMFVEPSEICLHLGHADFRKSINGLIVVVEVSLLQAHIFQIILNYAMKLTETDKHYWFFQSCHYLY